MSKYLPDIRAGDEYGITLTVRDTSGNPVDITGYKFWITLKSSFDLIDADAELQFSTTAGDNVNDNLVGGICHLIVPSSLTKSLLPGKYYYDVQQRVGTSILTVLPPVADYTDRITVVPEVTISI